MDLELRVLCVRMSKIRVGHCRQQLPFLFDIGIDALGVDPLIGAR